MADFYQHRDWRLAASKGHFPIGGEGLECAYDYPLVWCSLDREGLSQLIPFLEALMSKYGGHPKPQRY